MYKLILIRNRRIYLIILFYIFSSGIFLFLNNSENLYSFNFPLFFIEINFSVLFLYLYLPFLLYFYYVIDSKNKQYTYLYSIRFKSIEDYTVEKFTNILVTSLTLVLGLVVSSFIIWFRYKESVLVDFSVYMMIYTFIKFLFLVMYSVILLLLVELINIRIKDIYFTITLFILSYYFLFLIYSLGIYDKITKLIFGDSKLRNINYMLFEILNSNFIKNGFIDDFILISIYFSTILYIFFKTYWKYFYQVLEGINENY